MILIDSTYVNSGGARRLLEYFIAYSREQGYLDEYYFLFDNRLISEEIFSCVNPLKFRLVKPGEFQRLLFYLRLPNEITSVFCFANVPPPIRLNNRPVTILQHNLIYFYAPRFSLISKFLFSLKRLYVKSRRADHYLWIVQTKVIKVLSEDFLGLNQNKVLVLPFFELEQVANRSSQARENELTFIYPADGFPHKNHEYLFEVWLELAVRHNLFPTLYLTLPKKYSKLVTRISKLQEMGINIVNCGNLSRSELSTLYAKSKFLLFPSLAESMGLPLLEAANEGLKVIASDLPYLYEVVEPSAIFDPRKPGSLVDLLVSLHGGENLPETRITINNQISEVTQLIRSNRINKTGYEPHG